eukprot:COSAG02_NODE_49224_length_328_cov_0.707424_1_plen_29_part_10
MVVFSFTFLVKRCPISRVGFFVRCRMTDW